MTPRRSEGTRSDATRIPGGAAAEKDFSAGGAAAEGGGVSGGAMAHSRESGGAVAHSRVSGGAAANSRASGGMPAEHVPSEAAPDQPGPVGSAPTGEVPLIELRSVSKYFGNVIALKDVSMTVRAGEVMCLLGDNGAGKSTLIKCLSGVHPPDEGAMLVDGREVRFSAPRQALDLGIATVYQDLAMIPLMSIARNFFLGAEPTRGWGPLRRFDVRKADRVTREELGRMGIDVRDTTQPVGTLSGGERQSVAIARAVHFGARLLILDEPTSALGVKEAGIVLKYVARARKRGVGVVFITHNIHHAYPIGDRFTVLNRGRSYGTFEKSQITREKLLGMMAGGEELEELGHELDRMSEDA